MSVVAGQHIRTSLAIPDLKTRAETWTRAFSPSRTASSKSIKMIGTPYLRMTWLRRRKLVIKTKFMRSENSSMRRDCSRTGRRTIGSTRSNWINWRRLIKRESNRVSSLSMRNGRRWSTCTWKTSLKSLRRRANWSTSWRSKLSWSIAREPERKKNDICSMPDSCVLGL